MDPSIRKIETQPMLRSGLVRRAGPRHKRDNQDHPSFEEELGEGDGKRVQPGETSGPDSHPYAFAVVDDVIWYNESAMRPDTLVRFDPATEQFQSWAVPSGVGIIRNMWVTEAGNLLIHQSSSNRVGLVEIGD